MESVNVLVGWALPPPLMERIAAVDPRVRLLNDPYLDIPRPPVWPPFYFPEQLLPLFPSAQVVFTSRLPPDALSLAPGLRWLQLLSAGADVAIGDGSAWGGIQVTTARGVQAIPLSEWVVGAMIALSKRFPGAVRAQDRCEYWKFLGGELAERTVGILGMGSIGGRVARLCKALDMRVLGMRRSVTEARESPGEADLLVPPRDLPFLLRESDFLVLCLPRTRETAGLIGPAEFRQMKEGACLINVGRGGIVDEDALVEAVRSGRLAGAALDVFAQEPLPPESPLWSEPRILMTAHNAANSHRYEERGTELFLENLRRFLDGRELLNVYDRERGY
ncbi:MAG: D-2-hydroxyacid dehydrogenase [Chloroflexota bacterium]|nr:D-2-hydroxyacid dehydrogenase [Chloroflexota bacterium]MDE2942025.1 D-2-hydroxyacid dehydrogenase [Chloroflexota bacterium]MDE3267123.1 D-2-hydroxyacid dehydrogenase [Chloroflexota bacterium]